MLPGHLVNMPLCSPVRRRDPFHALSEARPEPGSVAPADPDRPSSATRQRVANETAFESAPRRAARLMQISNASAFLTALLFFSCPYHFSTAAPDRRRLG